MIKYILTLLIVTASVHVDAASDEPYINLDTDLTRLIEDFNRDKGKIRLLFIIGPTCGVCLRGMADIDDALLAERQSDPRIQTYSLHVPALGAEARHVEPTIQLLEGPRITHYWDGTGYSGLKFQETLEMPMYAWDVWLAYDEDAYWEPGNNPPKPVFWQHQLGSLDMGIRFDAEDFAEKTLNLVDQLGPVRTILDEPAFARTEPSVIKVAQPRGYMVQQNLVSRGAYARLIELNTLHMRGTFEADGQNAELSIRQSRPNQMIRTTTLGDHTSETRVEHGQIHYPDGEKIPKEWFLAHEFDGWLLEWKDKGHQLWRLGMIREDSRLPWLMEVEHKNGQIWHVYINSHTGDLYRRVLVERGEPIMTVEYDDFHDVKGYRFPHQITYSKAGQVIGIDRINSIQFTARSLEKSVSH